MQSESRSESRWPSLLLRVCMPGMTCPMIGILALLIVVGLGPNAVHAQESGQESPYSEKEAQSIDRMLMCPVCPAESIDQAQVEVSRQMKATVRRLLGEGASREEVLAYFVARYGEEVLGAPPKSGVNLLVWVLPIAGFLAALIALFFITRSMVSRDRVRQGGSWQVGSNPQNADDSRAELEPYLEAVDRELGFPISSGRTEPAPESGPGGALESGGDEPGVASKPDATA